MSLILYDSPVEVAAVLWKAASHVPLSVPVFAAAASQLDSDRHLDEEAFVQRADVEDSYQAHPVPGQSLTPTLLVAEWLDVQDPQ